mmetsp:Transcript_59123/g.183372  ORF Transcript_59123/g.183372 Transcript_59123/m.183372 type:complete len:212 (+) Transcript_59123:1794-2429(+)
MAEAASPHTCHDLRQALGAGLAVHEPVAGDDVALAGNLHKGHNLGVAWLKAHRGTRGHIQSATKGLGSVKDQRLVGLNEVVVGANLNGAIARVRDVELDQGSPLVELDALRLCRHDLARRGLVVWLLPEDLQVRLRQEGALEGQGHVAVQSADRGVHRQELRAVKEGGLDLHLLQKLRHAGQHLPPAQDLLAGVHEGEHGRAIADELHHLR